MGVTCHKDSSSFFMHSINRMPPTLPLDHAHLWSAAAVTTSTLLCFRSSSLRRREGDGDGLWTWLIVAEFTHVLLLACKFNAGSVHSSCRSSCNACVEGRGGGKGVPVVICLVLEQRESAA